MYIINTHPHISKEFHVEENRKIGVALETLKSYSNKKVWWLCPNGHSYQKYIYNRVLQGDGCHHCLSIAFLFPKIVEWWDYDFNPDENPWEIKPKSDKPVIWQCPNGHRFPRIVKVATRKDVHICPECKKK